MTSFGLFHVKTYRAGEAGYSSPLPRGHAEVWHDQKRYVYDMRCHRRPREFRAWVTVAWCIWGAPGHKLTGRYPSYAVE